MRNNDHRQVGRVCLGVAAGFAGLSLVWCWREPTRAERNQSGRTVDPMPVAQEEAARPMAGPFPWTAPPAQSRGPEWRYELFSAPPVRFDRARGTLFIASERAEVADFGAELSLMAVRRSLFRVQLQGGLGSADDCRAVLVQPTRTGVWLARAGERWPAAEVTVLKTEWATQASDEGSAQLSVVLRDDRSGEELKLVSGRPAFVSEWKAIVSGTWTDGVAREFAVGESWRMDGRECRIVRIEPEAPAVHVAIQEPGAAVMHRILRCRPEAVVANTVHARLTPAPASAMPASDHNR